MKETDYEAFERCLSIETELLEQWFIEQRFMERELAMGAEIEFFLLDKHYRPLGHNLALVAAIDDPRVVPEVGAAHMEINTPHVILSGDCLSISHQKILTLWKKCIKTAFTQQAHLALIGSLPTATQTHCKSTFITDRPRYHRINASMKKYHKQPVQLDIQGESDLLLNLDNIAINGLISALQLHIQIGFSQSVRFYNTAQALAAPMLALTANSPFLLGQHLWSESRIALFEQSMRTFYPDRPLGLKACIFGHGYLRDSFFELFDQNMQAFPRTLPEAFPDLPPEQMFHVRRQNGVIYRWNRPIIDFNQQLEPHLRIEHRGPSSGPTIVDMLANAAFFYGLINYFSIQSTPIEYLLPFHAAKNNFFNAARHGMQAKFKWFLNQEINAISLLNELIPLAQKGLNALGIIADDSKYYLNIIQQRVTKQMNGCNWQVQFVEKYGNDFYNLMERYLENQYLEKPVAEWTV